MKKFYLILVTSLCLSVGVQSQTCYTISNRTNGNGLPGTCGSPNCSGNAKTGHIEINFGASCPVPIPTLTLVSVTVGSLPSPFCFDPGNCISPGVVRYCFRGSNLPNSGSMVLNLVQGASAWNCTYDVNGGSGVVLPVKLTLFKTELQNGKVRITWHTEQEANSKQFIVERSGDGRTFSSVGVVAAQGSSYQGVDYSFYDVAPLKGFNFYRLKQVDLDGHFEYSAVSRIDNRIAGIQLTQLAPNPVADQLNLKITSEVSVTVVANIYNNLGVLVSSNRYQLRPGVQVKQIAMSQVTSGVYEIIMLSASGEKLAEKIVKQ